MRKVGNFDAIFFSAIDTISFNSEDSWKIVWLCTGLTYGIGTIDGEETTEEIQHGVSENFYNNDDSVKDHDFKMLEDESSSTDSED